MGLLPSAKLERVAQELARMASANEASERAGYDATAKSFGSNARKRACREDVKARVRELQEAAIPDVVADASAFIKEKCIKIIGYELGKSKTRVSDQIMAMTLLAKIIGAMAPEKVDLSLQGLGERLEAARRRVGS